MNRSGNFDHVRALLQVCAMRVPAEELDRQLPAMLQGLLLWAEDSKNKFRLKIRLVLERLVRR